MSRLTKRYTDAEESYIDLICFEDLDSYDVLCEVLDCGQYHGLIDAIYKLAEYENLGSVKEIKQLKHELEVYKRAVNKMVDNNLVVMGRQRTATNIDDGTTFYINLARKELEDESSN